MPSREDDQAPRRGDRIAKLLARAGVASRREIERMIADGRVAIDGAVVETPATILRSLAGVTVDGNPVEAPAPARLFLYHKPTGLLVTERDPRGRPIIYDRLPKDLPRVVPVGRLDLNTEGLLLLTTDGGLKRQLELPANGVERTYRARAYGQITQAQLEELIDGIEIEGIRYGSIDANLERRTGANVWIELTLTEGKNREVRRVLEHLGLEVSRLIRVRYGPFVLDDLPVGGVGEVRQVDLENFLRDLAKRKPPGPPPAPLGEGGRSPKASGGGARAPRPAKPLHPRAPRGGPPPRASSGRNKADQAHSHVSSSVRPEPVEGRAKQPTARATRPSTSSGRTNEKAGDTLTPRPERPKRKPGWARPKPKAGPKRPRK